MRSLLLSLVLAVPAVAQPPAPKTPPARLVPKKKAPPKPRGWLGIQLRPAEAPEQKALGLKRPVPKVQRIFRDSPAEKGGVQVDDYVVRFDGAELQSVPDLIRRVGAKAPGSLVEVELRRGDDRITLKIVLDLRVDMRERFRQEWLGRKMPAVTLPGVRPDDGTVDLTAGGLEGKVTVVDYWATWCGPCKRVMPELEQLSLDYERHAVRVIGVSGEEKPVLQKFLELRPVVYPIATDAGKTFSKEMMVSVLPTIWVIDREGIIREVFFGAGHTQKLEQTVRRLAGLAPLQGHRDHCDPSDPGQK